MNLFSQKIRLFTSFVLLLVLSFVINFTANISPVRAETLQLSNSYQLMAITAEKVKAETKKVEGKIQEEKGKITDDKEDQVVGKAKQVEGDVRSTFEDIKQQTEEFISNITE